MAPSKKSTKASPPSTKSKSKKAMKEKDPSHHEQDESLSKNGSNDHPGDSRMEDVPSMEHDDSEGHEGEMTPASDGSTKPTDPQGRYSLELNEGVVVKIGSKEANTSTVHEKGSGVKRKSEGAVDGEPSGNLEAQLHSVKHEVFNNIKLNRAYMEDKIDKVASHFIRPTS